ncbi:hypothetical protein F2Q68_00006418 [Brassica cretica]|uniref:Uncharacterized protein n=2 Tax=Brassica cretica TaxID=69181 RepID=A0ABQ7BZE7_BRACR|nr:hypothetical protein F2Q68_00006418 [Brassica cretica]KAF3544438.1 hypothetical protein DY000_02009886 [Brassica cretica]
MNYVELMKIKEVKNYDTEKTEMKSKEVMFEVEIFALKTDLATRDAHIDASNKDFENKLRYNTLMAEKAGVCDKVNQLKFEMSTREIQDKQMEELIC